MLFLHSTLKDHVFIRQPQGYVNDEYPTHVCHLHKALYGLKQAPQAWCEWLSQSLLSLGFKNSLANSSLFVLHRDHDLVYVLVYVDDILIPGLVLSLSLLLSLLYLEP